MSLRQKLLLVALCTLALPVAGWLYVRQMETLLRQGQEQALTATATAVARSLAVTDVPLPQPGNGWYVQQAVNPITIDGYGDDWAPMTPWSQPVGKNGKLLLAEDDNGFYVYVDVRAARRMRADAGDPNALTSDHLILDLVQGSQHRRYLIASAAPGAFAALTLDPPAADLPDRIVGQWQEDGSGYRAEMRLPRGLGLSALGVGVYSGLDGGDPLAASVSPLWRYSPDLAQELSRMAPEDTRTRLVAPSGWLLAQSGHLTTTGPQPGWLSSVIYRSLLANPLEEAEPWTADVPRLDLPEVQRARTGQDAD
jgi:two-component system sensor histidine kinase ChvG